MGIDVCRYVIAFCIRLYPIKSKPMKLLSNSRLKTAQISHAIEVVEVVEVVGKV
jgi:hypothetical protein